MFKTKSNQISEDAENDRFYEQGSLKNQKHSLSPNIDDDDDADTPFEHASNHQNNLSDDYDDDDDEESESDDIEPSMHSIPEHDDHIESLINNVDFEPSMSSHLAPHWLPQNATSAVAGHHNRDFSHLNESGYADNDSDSDDEIDNNMKIDTSSMQLLMNKELTPPVSDADNPISPYYEDTPLMKAKSINSAFDISPIPSPQRTQNSLNMGPILDELEKEHFALSDHDNDDNDNDSDDQELSVSYNSMSGSGTQTPSMDRGSFMRSIPEWEDTDDETSANDTDAATYQEHMRHLSTHIEDQMDLDDLTINDSVDRLKPINMKSSLIRMSSNKSEPGHTPPPASPRYKHQKIKMSKAHKRKLSDKLDAFLSDRSNASQLVAKSILFATPCEDIEVSMQQKREKRDKIKKRLKRKLSHDFRPSEQDILERGIKIIPTIIRSDEEDEDEEVIVYDDADRNSFSLMHKGSKDTKNAKAEERDFARILKKTRQRNSKKLAIALVDRPSPSDIIEKGIISADNVNNAIPTISKYEMLKRYEADLRVKEAENEQCKICKEQNVIRKKRRIRILSFYDNYLFNTMYDEDEKEQFVDIEADYLQILENVQSAHQNHVSKKRDYLLFNRKDVCLKLYAIKDEEMSLEKEWMRNLRKRKFRSYVNQKKNANKRRKKEEIERNLNELMDQIELVSNTQKVERMNSELLRLENQRIALIENTTKQIDDLRQIIKHLNAIYLHKRNEFVAVS